MDSTFALAGMALASAAGWTVAPGAARRGLELAWAGRDRLRPADKALVLAEVGPRYPAISTLAEHLQAWERAVDLAPDQADRWYELGDMYFHEGPYLGIESSRRRASDAFRRSVALDSGTGAARAPGGDRERRGDTAEARRLGALYPRRTRAASCWPSPAGHLAVGLSDERTLAELRARYRQMPLQSLWRIMNYAVLDGRGLEDAESAAGAIRAKGGRISRSIRRPKATRPRCGPSGTRTAWSR